jgi:hypothetical protein
MTVADGTELDPRYCNADKRTGGPCQLRAGHGTDHVGVGRCRRHGGNTPSHVASAQMQQAVAAAEKWGLPVEVGAKEALVEELAFSSGLVRFYAAQVSHLEAHQMHGPVGGGQGGFPEEKPNIWIVLHAAERKHRIAVAKICHDVGVDEWRMEMAEQAGQWIADAVKEFCRLRGLSLEEPETRKAVEGSMRLIQGGGQAA